MLARALSPKVEITLGKERWWVVFTHRVLLRVEELTGKNILIGELDVLSPDSFILKCLLQATSGKDKLDWNLLSYKKIQQILPKIQEAFFGCLPLPDVDNPASTNPVVPGTWTDAWANAHENLHISSDEWMDSTPRMIQALSKYHLESIRQREYMFAQIIAQIANWSQSRPQDPINPVTYMLHKWDIDSTGPTQTVEGILNGFLQSKMTDDATKTEIFNLLHQDPNAIN